MAVVFASMLCQLPTTAGGVVHDALAGVAATVVIAVAVANPPPSRATVARTATRFV